MHRYGGLSDWLSLPALTGAQVLEKAREMEIEERLHREWSSILPAMQKGELKLIQFDDYMDRRLGRNIDTRPADVILAELEEKFGRSLV